VKDRELPKRQRKQRASKKAKKTIYPLNLSRVA